MTTSKMKIKGYKVFNPDWTCLKFKYEVGKTYKHKGEIKPCSKGFHFCEKLIDCFNYYPFNPNNKVAEIEATGDILKDGDKSVTSEITIVKELDWHTVLEMVNTGKGNRGKCNSGDYNSGYYNSGSSNSGNYNSGDYNSGYYNSGKYNSGYYNSGYYNSGYYNSGYRNSGWYNSGDYNSGWYNSGNYNSGYYNSGYYNSGNYNSGSSNSGNYNSGDYNSGDYNSGYYNSGHCNSGWYNACAWSNGLFNTKSPKISMFNKQTRMTFEEFREKHYRAYALLSTMRLTKWIPENNMTDEEKEEHPSYKTTCGYLKTYTYKEACQNMWNKWSEDERNLIMKLPNFDKEIFKEITGIEV